MITPDGHALYVGDRGTGFFRQLTHGAVVIETGHGGELPGIEIRGIFHRDQGVGVSGVANHEHPHVPAGVSIQSLSLRPEDLAVFGQQITSLHAFAAWLGTDQQSVLDVLESNVGIIGCHHVVKQRKGAVIELHHDPVQSLHRRGDFQQL